jgi:hypothetical protein
VTEHRVEPGELVIVYDDGRKLSFAFNDGDIALAIGGFIAGPNGEGQMTGTGVKMFRITDSTPEPAAEEPVEDLDNILRIPREVFTSRRVA